MKKSLISTLFCAAAIGSAMCSVAVAKDTVTVSGSTTVLPVMQKISETLMKNDSSLVIELSGGGSGSGIKALNEGLTQIAMSSRKIKAEEVKAAEAKNIKPYPITVAIDAIVPIVNPQNKVSDLSLEKLRKIFKGEIKNWKELGGADAPIIPVSRDTSSGTYETWESLVMKKERITPKALLQSSNGTVVQAVAKNPNAIGYIGLSYVVPSIKSISIDGTDASAETALNKKWPLSRELYLYTNGAPSKAVKKVTDYCLSGQGQKLVKEVGYIPVSNK